MATVSITVDCEAADKGRCYTRELVRAAEEFTVPLTWLILTSEKDPLSNLDLYYNEFFHRIPSWHEVGLLVRFENSHGYISDPGERGNAIRVGRDALKSRHVKPTSFRAAGFDLLPSDLRHLEDSGFLVESSSVPGAADKHGVSRPPAPEQPYRPSYENLNKPGDAKILAAPLATHRGVCGYLDLGWEKVQPILDRRLTGTGAIVLAVSDYVGAAETLRKTIALCKERGARFSSLTQLAAEA